MPYTNTHTLVLSISIKLPLVSVLNCVGIWTKSLPKPSKKPRDRSPTRTRPVELGGGHFPETILNKHVVIITVLSSTEIRTSVLAVNCSRIFSFTSFRANLCEHPSEVTKTTQFSFVPVLSKLSSIEDWNCQKGIHIVLQTKKGANPLLCVGSSGSKQGSFCGSPMWSAYQPQVTLESRRKHPSQEVVRNSDSPNQLFGKNHDIGWKRKECCCFDFFCTNKDHIKLFDRCAISLHIPFQHFPQEQPKLPKLPKPIPFCCLSQVLRRSNKFPVVKCRSNHREACLWVPNYFSFPFWQQNTVEVLKIS